MSRSPTLAKSKKQPPATKKGKAVVVKKTQPASQENLIASKGKRAMTPAQLANLRPVKKGEVRNPQGINAFTGAKAAMMTEAQRLQAKAMKVLETQLNSTDERVAQAAAREVLDRAFGKPVAPVAETDSSGNDRPAPPPMVVVPVQVVNSR